MNRVGWRGLIVCGLAAVLFAAPMHTLRAQGTPPVVGTAARQTVKAAPHNTIAKTHSPVRPTRKFVDQAPRPRSTSDKIVAAPRMPVPAPTLATFVAAKSGTPNVSASPVPQQAASAAAFVAAFLDDAFRLARSGGTLSPQHRDQLGELFAAKMDIGRIAAYTGGDELAAASADTQRRFRASLIGYLVETYYPRLELASDPSVSVVAIQAPSLPDGTAVVWTIFTKSGYPPQSVKWQMAASNGSFKIIDTFAAGASVVEMERATFLSVMRRNGGLPDLMARLDARTRLLASAAPN